MKKKIYLSILSLFLLGLIGCTANKDEENVEEKEEVQNSKIEINNGERFQIVNSFGASGAWWSQDIGGWVEKENELSKRDYIAELLFDSEKGIGLSSYRYNLGAGSAETQNSLKITDPWRRSESFESSPQVYDWSKDENAQYMLQKALQHGVEDIYLFSNSPLERLTKNGSAYGSDNNGDFGNLDPKNYQEFFDYLFDVTEHFLEMDIPVTHLSPFNEPQWEWLDGQEGNHLTPEEVVDLSKKVYEAKLNRPGLADVELSVPELGEWGNTSYDYYDAMIQDEDFMKYYDTWDIHSYWTSTFQKEDAKDYFEKNKINVQLKMSEWTEMVNGKDLTMDSALNLANQIHEDLTILNVIDWQYWIAVSAYDYRDGLIYVDTSTQEIELSKRLWTMGNFSKFIRPGATRIQVESEVKALKVVGFENKDGSIYVIGINNNDVEMELQTCENVIKAAYLTSENQDLESIEIEKNSKQLNIPGKSVVTIELKE